MSLQRLSKLLYFFAWFTLFKYAMFHLYSCLTPILVDLRNLFLLSTPVTPRWVNRDQKCEIVIHIFISRLTILTTFSPSSHYVEEATFYTLIWFELNSISILSLQWSKCYIPLQWAYCLLVATAMISVMENHGFLRWIWRGL